MVQKKNLLKHYPLRIVHRYTKKKGCQLGHMTGFPLFYRNFQSFFTKTIGYPATLRPFTIGWNNFCIQASASLWVFLHFFYRWNIKSHGGLWTPTHHIIVEMFQKITRAKCINMKNKNAANYRKDVIPLCHLWLCQQIANSHQCQTLCKLTILHFFPTNRS